MLEVLIGASSTVVIFGALYTALRFRFDPCLKIVIVDDGNPFEDGRLVKCEIDQIRIHEGLDNIPLIQFEGRIPRTLEKLALVRALQRHLGIKSETRSPPDKETFSLISSLIRIDRRIPRPGSGEVRTISPGVHRVRFITQNVGQRPTGPAKLRIRPSDSSVGIVGFSSEALRLYAYAGFHETSPNSPMPLTNIADELLGMWRDLGMTGDYLSVVGEFAGGSFDAGILHLNVPKGVEEFALVFRLESEKAMSFKTVLYQWYKVVPAAEVDAG